MAERVVVMYAGQIAEIAEVDELFKNPKHPYTQALLGSIPRMDQDEEELSTIGGIVPSIQNMPKKGCRFADRCKKAFGDCTHITPQLAKVDEEHSARCLLYDTCYPEKHPATEEVQ